jgi:predicted acetyltransferase
MGKQAAIVDAGVIGCSIALERRRRGFELKVIRLHAEHRRRRV